MIDPHTCSNTSTQPHVLQNHFRDLTWGHIWSRPHLKEEGRKGPQSLPQVTSVSRAFYLFTPGPIPSHGTIRQARPSTSVESCHSGWGNDAQECEAEDAEAKMETMGDVARTGIWLWSYVNVRRDREVKKSPRENMRQRQCYEPKRSVMFNQRSRGLVLLIYSQLSWLSPGHKAWRMYRNDQRAYPGLCKSDRETGLIHK